MKPKCEKASSLFPLAHKPARIMNISVAARHLFLTNVPLSTDYFLYILNKLILK